MQPDSIWARLTIAAVALVMAIITLAGCSSARSTGPEAGDDGGASATAASEHPEWQTFSTDEVSLACPPEWTVVADDRAINVYQDTLPPPQAVLDGGTYVGIDTFSVPDGWPAQPEQRVSPEQINPEWLEWLEAGLYAYDQDIRVWADNHVDSADEGSDKPSPGSDLAPWGSYGANQYAIELTAVDGRSAALLVPGAWDPMNDDFYYLPFTYLVSGDSPWVIVVWGVKSTSDLQDVIATIEFKQE